MREVATTRFVLERGERIELVMHNEDDTWEVRGQTRAGKLDVVVAPMDRLIAADSALEEVARIPAGWSAHRFGTDDWIVFPETDTGCASIPEQGYFLDLGGSGSGHYFCGEHQIDGAWCPNCAKPLLRMLSLDARDRRLGLESMGVPFLHFLFCWTCNLGQRSTAYRLRPDGGIQLIRYRPGGVTSGFPYANYPRAFPGRTCELVPLTSSAQGLIDGINSKALSIPSQDTRQLGLPRHQVGGRPLLLQGTPSALCPVCSLPMAFVACFVDDTLDGRGFTGNDVQVIFMLCVQDAILSSFQECD